MATTADRFGPWTWSAEYGDHFMVVYHSDGSHDYKWSRSIQPTQATTAPAPVSEEHPYSNLTHSGGNYQQPNQYATSPTALQSATPRTAEPFPAQNLPHLAPSARSPSQNTYSSPPPGLMPSPHYSMGSYTLHSPSDPTPRAPVSYFKYYPPGPIPLPSCPIHTQSDYKSSHFLTRCYCGPPSNPYYATKRNMALRPRQFGPPTTSMPYCDHPYCEDPDCLRTQIRTNGWRDDLIHHEDGDKNGNMNDGDNVGQHQLPRRTDGTSSSLSDSDSEGA